MKRVALLGAATLAAYALAPLGGFVWDDHKVIERGRLIGSLANLPSVWTHDTMFNSDGGLFQAEATLDTYRPLTMTSFFVEAALFGRRPWPFHVDNVLLHLGCVLLLFAVGQRLGASARAAFFGALVFAVHPALAEAVFWINGRSDPLCTLLFLGALYAWLDGRAAATALLMAAAALSKETAFALALPVALLWRPADGAAWRRAAPWLGGAALGLLLRLAALRRVAVAAGGAHLGWALVRLPALWLDGLAALLLPSGGAPPSLFERYRRVSAPRQALALAVLALLLAGARARWRRGDRLPAWALATALTTLAPVALLTFNEGWNGWGRYLYPAAPSVCLAAAALVVDGALPRLRRELARLVAVGAALLVALCLAQTIAAGRRWRDDRAFFSAIRDEHPEQSIGYSELAVLELSEGRAARALELAELAVERAPASPLNWSRVASALMRLERRPEAFRAAEQAIVLARGRLPDNNARYIVAIERLGQRRQAEAAELLLDTLRADPEQAGPWQTLAQAVAHLGRDSEFAATLRRLAAEPRYRAVAPRVLAAARPPSG
jgi:Tfp pilus assembly protein PilF